MIRPATDPDLDGAAVVWRESASRMDGATQTPAREDLRRRIDEELAADWDLHVAVRGGRVIALLALNPADGVLDQLFVSPAEQGRGIGTALLEVAKRAMPGGFTLRTASSNAAARAFYARRGFRLAREGHHPRTGDPVCFYAWDGG